MNNYNLYIILGAIIISLILIIPFFIETKKRKIDNPDLIYNDRYIEIYNDHLVLAGYYLGPIGRKKFFYNDIKSIDIRDLTIKTGKYRIQGTGDFKTWFTQDLKRSKRGKAFILTKKNKRLNIGFTVEDFDRVFSIFKGKELINI